MNPLTAQQISRTEASLNHRQEATRFLKAKRQPFQFIARFFKSTKQQKPGAQARLENA